VELGVLIPITASSSALNYSVGAGRSRGKSSFYFRVTHLNQDVYRAEPPRIAGSLFLKKGEFAPRECLLLHFRNSPKTDPRPKEYLATKRAAERQRTQGGRADLGCSTGPRRMGSRRSLRAAEENQKRKALLTKNDRIRYRASPQGAPQEHGER